MLDRNKTQLSRTKIVAAAVIDQIDGPGRILTRAQLGYLAERAPLRGADSPPPLPNSRTHGSSEVGEAANESSG